MLLDILIICSLISSPPYYDCSEQWTIEINNSPVPCFDSLEFVLAAGCTDFSTKTIKIYEYAMHDVKDPDDGFTVLEHELEHLKCMCNFHSKN